MCLFDLFDCRIMIDSPMASEAESNEKRGVWKLEPYAGVDYNLTLCRLRHIYHGQPSARIDLKPIPESTLTLCQKSTLSPSQVLRIWPLHDD
jgi:hypothetical protein